MRTSKLLLMALVCGVGGWLASGSASAEVINVTTGAQLFGDTFEELGTNVSHTDYTHNDGGDYDPLQFPGYGMWSVVEQGEDRVQVTDATGLYGPGAFQGSNYLRLVRDGVGEPTVFQTFQANQATPSDHIRFSEMVYITPSDAGKDNPVSIAGLGTGDVIRFDVITNNSPAGASSVGNYTGAWPPAAIPIAYTAGQWQKWQIDYLIGATTYDLTIGQSTVSGIPAMSAGDFGTIRIFSDSQVFLDEVPEPSGVVLLLSATAGLLACAWRKGFMVLDS